MRVNVEVYVDDELAGEWACIVDRFGVDEKVQLLQYVEEAVNRSQ